LKRGGQRRKPETRGRCPFGRQVGHGKVKRKGADAQRTGEKGGPAGTIVGRGNAKGAKAQKDPPLFVAEQGKGRGVQFVLAQKPNKKSGEKDRGKGGASKVSP